MNRSSQSDQIIVEWIFNPKVIHPLRVNLIWFGLGCFSSISIHQNLFLHFVSKMLERDRVRAFVRVRMCVCVWDRDRERKREREREELRCRWSNNVGVEDGKENSWKLSWWVITAYRCPICPNSRRCPSCHLLLLETQGFLLLEIYDLSFRRL